MAATTVVGHLSSCTHKNYNNNIGRKVTGNKSGIAVTTIISGFGRP